MREQLHFISSADQNYYEGLSVTLASLVERASGDYDYVLHILDGGIDTESHTALRSLLEKIAHRRGVSLRYHPHHVTSEFLSSFPVWRNNQMTFSKFYAIQQLTEASSAIYLDSDTLINRGVEELHTMEKRPDTLLAGVRDFFSQLGNEYPGGLTLDAEDRQSPYINAGIMWMNLEVMRKEKIIAQALTMLEQSSDLRKGDQTIFNYLCRHRIQCVDDSFNLCMGLGSGQRVVNEGTEINLHYIGSHKPWMATLTTTQLYARRLWHAYAQKIGMFPQVSVEGHGSVPHDHGKYACKRFNFLNPARAKKYWGDYTSSLKQL